MPLSDYTDTLQRVQQALGKGFAEEPWILNMPGKSIACKIDQYYYLAIMPIFVDHLARLGGTYPDRIAEVLIKTGNLITKGPDRDPVLRLTVGWGGRPVTLRGAFVDADFIDRAVKTYGGFGSILNVSELKISEADKDAVDALFEGKTPPQKLAYF